MALATIADRILLVIMVVLPPLIIWRFKGWGILLAAAVLYFAMPLLGAANEAEKAPMRYLIGGDMLLLIGWLPALIYSSLLFAVVSGLQALIGWWRIKRKAQMPG
jgi:hypothetical protein